MTPDKNKVPKDSYKAQLRATWDGLGPAWQQWQDFFECGAGQITEWMVNAARVGAGDVVLDVATGAGEPALTVSEIVGPAGRVVGIDQSEKMVEAARLRAGERDNLTFLVEDIEQLGEEAGSNYDVVLSRFGLMFTESLPRSLATFVRVMNGGGRCSIAAWSAPRKVPVIGLAFGIAAAKLELPPPPPDIPGPFGMAEPGPVLDALSAAGFVNVCSQEVTITFKASSADEFVAYCQATLPGWLAAKVAERFGTEKDSPVWSEVAESVAPYTQPDGRLELPSVAVCYAGQLP